MYHADGGVSNLDVGNCGHGARLFCTSQRPGISTNTGHSWHWWQNLLQVSGSSL